MNKTYFCHIPRTSGRSVIATMHARGAGIKGYDLASYSGGRTVAALGPEEILTGHLGILPALADANINCYALVRDPVDHFASTVSHCISDDDHDDVAISLARAMLSCKTGGNYPFFANRQISFLLGNLSLAPLDGNLALWSPRWKRWTSARLRVDSIAWERSATVTVYPMSARKSLITDLSAATGARNDESEVTVRDGEKRACILEFCAAHRERILATNTFDRMLYEFVENNHEGVRLDPSWSRM